MWPEHLRPYFKVGVRMALPRDASTGFRGRRWAALSPTRKGSRGKSSTIPPLGELSHSKKLVFYRWWLPTVGHRVLCFSCSNFLALCSKKKQFGRRPFRIFTPAQCIPGPSRQQEIRGLSQKNERGQKRSFLPRSPPWLSTLNHRVGTAKVAPDHSFASSTSSPTPR